MKLLIFALAILGVSGVQRIPVPPFFVSGVVGGGTVVAKLWLESGRARKLQILSGGEPFAGCARKSLLQWRFPPPQKPEPVLVVVRFRRSGCTNIGAALPAMPSFRADSFLPFPTNIVDPVCPSNLAGPGYVELLASISSEGYVTSATVVDTSGIHPDTSAVALLNWRFIPALNALNSPAPSYAFVFMIFTPSPL